MILLLAALAILLTVLVSVLTACAVAVRSFTGASRALVGDPPAGLDARAVSIPCGGHALSKVAWAGSRNLAQSQGRTKQDRVGVPTPSCLAGWFAPGRPGRGAVILLHGLRSDRRALATRMTMLARGGSAVLAVDLRAHGESDGSAVTLGLREAEDAAAAMGWLRAAAPGERLGGIGISLGGAALALASRTAPVDALVLESVFPDIAGAIRNRMALVAGPAAPWLTPLFTAVGAGMTGLRPADLRPIEAVAAYPGPVLVIGGGADPLTTPSETRALFAAAPGEKRLWIVDGAGHVDMASAAGSDYEARVTAFLRLHLEQKTPCA